MNRRCITTVILILALAWIPSIAQASTKAGGKCSKVGTTTTISGAKYRCTKLGKNLIWEKIRISVKPAVSPTTPAAKLAQVITAPRVKSVDIANGSFTAPFASNSNLPVVLSTTTPLICGVQENSITLLQTGSCEISASQPGNDKFLPAPPLNFSLEITPPVITSDNALLDQVQTFIRVPKGATYASDTAEITLTAFSSDATAKVCAADPSADGCTLASGVGIADPASLNKYVEFDFHVKNLDPNPLPSISYRLLQNGVLSDINAGVTLDTLNGLSVGSGESADGSLYGIVPLNQKFDGGYLLIDEGITDPSIRLLLSLA